MGKTKLKIYLVEVFLAFIKTLGTDSHKAWRQLDIVCAGQLGAAQHHSVEDLALEGEHSALALIDEPAALDRI
jgi:imidazoleglycerol phosphate dehydratase HisB